MHAARCFRFSPCTESFLLGGSAGGKNIADPGHSGEVVENGVSCSVQLTGVALQRESSPAVHKEREGIKWFLHQNHLQSTLLFSLLSPKFEKPVVWRREKTDLEGKLWMCGEQM